ncbi:endoplasmic reticulum membrane sensor NFE2L1-like isoform X1 [Mastacembelus armatus]|uniref:Endoplasmic reticulum membrane sensor NFE2L1 n=1 Tax=Mastacembelus armatus TaxID=205130 RepID=A0A3Q3KKB3_9TELE|nr:endoplasmic reticulum membrane sensor NFE2L1-like isoform X1 [Mastacembelus armatus]
MLYLKKYFMEGLIQMAILLSLCGMRVDVGLDLPPSWHEMILGPTSALTQTQFHNLRNRLEDGHGLHPKSVDVDSFFTTRRLLGWVRSLDRLEVPHAQLETWLVQREPEPLPLAYPNQPSPLERAPTGVEREQTGQPVEPRARRGTMQDEEEADDKETCVSLEECLRLLEETLPFTADQQLSDIDGSRGDMGPDLLGTEPLLSPIIPTDSPSSNLELPWQDLFALMEPENTHVDRTTSFNPALDSRASETLWGDESEALYQVCNSVDSCITEVDQEDCLMDIPLQHGLLGSLRQSELGQLLLPLTPSAELDDHSSVLNTREALKNSNMNTWHSPPDHTNFFTEDTSDDFCMGLNTGDNSSVKNINLLAQDLVDNMDGTTCSQYPHSPENLASMEVNFHYLTPSGPTTSLEENDIIQELLTSPPSEFLLDKEEGVDDLHCPVNLLEDVTILDEILALEEDFSPEMTARLEKEGYHDPEISLRKTGRRDNESVSSMAVAQDVEDETDSDSGLSLDFSYNPASPCASEASSYSSSSSSSSNSSSSWVSSMGSPFSKDDDAEKELVGSDMEVEVTIKEEQEEEEMGAVGGGYPEDVKKLLPNYYENHKMLKGFSWLEHIDHDHTYNQPWSSASSPSLGKSPTKRTKSSLRHYNARPYHSASSRHISVTEMWSRDERRARALRIPFSNELIVNLPVEEFNDLLINYQLSEEQLTLIRDIRRRGKNKIAAQNCRKRKMNVLLGLEDDVSDLRHHHSQLFREKQEALRNLQEMKRRLSMLYQHVFSRLRDEDGRPLDTTEYVLHFGPNGCVTVASRQGELRPLTAQNSKKPKDKKK